MKRTPLKRKTPLRKVSKNPRPKLKKRVDDIHSRLIRKKYGCVCVVCGSTNKVGCGHIFSREHEATRWDTQEDGNCHPQCWPCNFGHEHNPWPYFAWYIGKYGKDALDTLEARWHTDTPYRGVVRLRELREKLQRELDSLD